MNKEEKKLVLETYKDCIRLRKRKDLAEFGKGQLVLCKMLLKIA